MRLLGIYRILRVLRLGGEESQPLIEERNANSDKRFNQYLVAFVANFLAFSWGTSMGWSSPALVKMTDEPKDSPLNFIPSEEQLSWIGSILPIGAFFGILFAPLPEWIGRKQTLLLNALIFIGSFSILIFTHDLESIYVARFMQGFASGVTNFILPMYIAEISSASCRGILSSFIQIGLVCGILYAYIIGPYLSYKMLQWLCLVNPIVFIVLFLFMPETPHFYVSNGHRDDAVESLKFLRQKNYDGIAEELFEIERSVHESKIYRARVSDVFKGPNLTAFIISFGLICFQNFTGIDAIVFHSQIIFNKACSSIEPALASILIASIMVVASCIAPFFVETTGRKKLLIISSLGMVASHTAMGAYFLCSTHNLVRGFGWVPLVSLVSFILFYCLGFGPLPFTILGEMFSPEIKSLASSIAVSTSWIVDFGATKAFLPLEATFGSYVNFLIFGCFCVLAFIFTITKVIETRGLSLSEIQEKLNKRSC